MHQTIAKNKEGSIQAGHLAAHARVGERWRLLVRRAKPIARRDD